MLKMVKSFKLQKSLENPRNHRKDYKILENGKKNLKPWKTVETPIKPWKPPENHVKPQNTLTIIK